MLTEARQRRIVDTVHSSGAASVRSLARRLEVSESTIRRDLQRLDRNGELVRTYGGAISASGRGPGAPPSVSSMDTGADGPEVEAPFVLESGQDLALKQRVARAAAALIDPGDVVILDIGTTTALLARELRGRDVTVITSNLGVLDELRNDDAVRVVLLGGVVRRNYQTLVGSLAESGLRQVNADAVFLSCTGVRRNGRVVDNMAVETPIKQAMIDAADQVVLLATEAKFPGTGSLRVCSLNTIDVLVTTDGADTSTTQLCRDAGGRVITV